MNGIDYTVGVGEKIRAIDPSALEALKEVGFTFEAGSGETT